MCHVLPCLAGVLAIKKISHKMSRVTGHPGKMGGKIQMESCLTGEKIAMLTVTNSEPCTELVLIIDGPSGSGFPSELRIIRATVPLLLLKEH